jgi:hypothetical protein
MFKPILLLASLLIGAAQAVVYLPSGVTHAMVQKSPAKEIAWDIHGPIAQKQRSLSFNKIGLGISYLFGNSAWDHIHSLSKNADVSGEGQAYIAKKYNHSTLAKMIEKEANSYKPRKGIEKLITSIHTHGITQRLASNIGPQFLSNLDARFKKKYKSQIFSIIKPGKVVDYSNYGPQPTVTTARHLSAIGKPHIDFFNGFNAIYNTDKKNYIIFIDDKMENITSALKAGWIGIYFDSSKKKPVKHLENDLKSLGVIF